MDIQINEQADIKQIRIQVGLFSHFPMFLYRITCELISIIDDTQNCIDLYAAQFSSAVSTKEKKTTNKKALNEKKGKPLKRVLQAALKT